MGQGAAGSEMKVVALIQVSELLQFIQIYAIWPYILPGILEVMSKGVRVGITRSKGMYQCTLQESNMACWKIIPLVR